MLIECHSVRHLAAADQRPGLGALADIRLVPAAERLADSAGGGRRDEQFHVQRVPAGRHREMARVQHEITERIRVIRRLDFAKPVRIDATGDQHARSLRAITRRRADDAVGVRKAHVEQSKREMRHVTLETLHRARQRG